MNRLPLSVVVLFVAGAVCAAPDGNDGVLNGPLRDHNLGHRAQGEGTPESLRLAIEDMIATFGSRYPMGREYLQRLERITAQRGPNATGPLAEAQSTRSPSATSAPPRETKSCTDSAEFQALKREALLANPILDFHKILCVRSRGKQGRYAKNWQTRDSCKASGYDDELVALSIADGTVATLFKPARGLVADVDLHFDAGRILFSSFVDRNSLGEDGPTGGKGYAVMELAIDPATGKPKGEARRVSPAMGKDVNCYDACYVADDSIIFASTAAYDGVPCVGGGSYVANLYRVNADGSGVRRLTFDQDGNWHPSVMSDGRVMYTRWEYTDQAHYFSRILMSMNPDGTDQKAHYGSNSYWPNSIFYARQIPGKPGMFIATITGHHSNAKGGALCLFDVSKGRHEADGAVQFITGRGKKVQPLVIDNLARVYHPHFYEPYPLSDPATGFGAGKYFLAMAGGSIWLLDAFDNMLCLQRAGDGWKYSEPIPLRRTERPSVQPERVNLAKKMATVLVSDVYEGPGLRGVPRGTVKSLRVYRYEYGPRHKGGHYAMGMEAGWDAKQVLGTAPVEEDGSASFEVPANTPFAVQPLDKHGRAVQLMRSWTVAMPGEALSCIGCHESQNTAPPTRRTEAMMRAPSRIKPFQGPTRGFSYTREIQPIIDRHCVSCHDGKPANGRYKAADRVIGTGPHTGRKFTDAGIPDLSTPRNSHGALHPYVRRNGPEGDNHVLTPLEFHVNTSELFQMLDKGHHNVKLDGAAMERLVTWADLNAPFHGTWTEAGAKRQILDRRKALRKKYASDDYDPEAIVNPYVRSTNSILPDPLNLASDSPCPAEPEAAPLQGAERLPVPRASHAPQIDPFKPDSIQLDLGNGVTLDLVRVPAGAFSMGSNDETSMEQPVSRAKIKQAFFMGATEVTLRQYRQFDRDYLNGVYDMHYKDQCHRGYYMNDMDFPVIRVSWHKAMAFCEWLSQKTGRKVSLPSEAQWEWACRAGTDTPLSYGDLDADFSPHANLADLTVRRMAVKGVNPRPIKNPPPHSDFELKDPRWNDGALHLAEVASYQPNAWGLHDMHGNAAEWTRSDYLPYPYRDDGRNAGGDARKTVRGGSWHDRPFRATSSYRLGFPPWQRVYHTGFRVVVEGGG